jgi:glycosyltransferase involved in cell wall biosynthesis
MKNILKVTLFGIALILSTTSKLFAAENKANIKNKHIVVITCSYKNKDWYKQNLDSFRTQDYNNKTMIYIDDCSPDGTGNLVEQYIKDYGLEKEIILVKNQKNIGAMANQYYSINSCKNDDIIVILDGDDFFAHDKVLSYVNEVYQDQNVWLTYGQFKHLSNNQIGFCCPMPEHIVKNNLFRSVVDIPSHLRTFYAGLFKKIKIQDLMYEGNFLKMTCDIAAMFPMIEMAREGHFRFIPNVLLTYNDLNCLNDHKVSKDLQRKLDLYIRSIKKYSTIVSPFID